MSRSGVRTMTWEEFVQRTGSTEGALVTLALSAGWLDSEIRAELSDARERETFRWIKALDVAQWSLFEGASMEECGKRLGVSRQRAQQLLALLGDLPAPPGGAVAPRRASDAKNARRIELFRTATERIRQNPGASIEDLSSVTNAGVQELREVLGSLMSFVVNTSAGLRKGDIQWTNAQIEEALRARVDKENPIVTKAHYEATAGEGDPSVSGIIRRYATWNSALAAAGLMTADARQDYAWARPRDEVIKDVVNFMLETCSSSVRAYAEWQTNHPEALASPHHSQGFSTWREVADLAFAEMRTGEQGARFRARFDELVEQRADELSRVFRVEFSVPARANVPKSTDPLPGE